MYVSLDLIKKHLNIDFNFNEDNPYLISLYKVSEEIVQRHIDTDLSTLVDEEGNIPAPLVHAILLLIGNFYILRESISEINITKVPNSFEYILSLYQNYYPSKFKTE